MKNRLFCVAALSGFLITSGAWAQTPDVMKPPAKTEAKKKAKKPKTESGAKAKFIPGSQETKRERSARLTRECKGEVNAGACTGYAR